MRLKAGIRIGIVVVAAAYFPIKLYLLDKYQPQFWLRIGLTAIFWVTLFGVGILSERYNRSNSN